MASSMEKEVGKQFFIFVLQLSSPFPSTFASFSIEDKGQEKKV